MPANFLRVAFTLVPSFALAFLVGLMMTGRMSTPPVLMSAVDEAINCVPSNMISWTGLRSSEPAVLGTWPPAKGETYPDLILSDQNGDTVKLSDFAGKVILLELAAVPCGGCQAFAGGNQYGVFLGGKVQKGLDSIHHYAQRFAGIRLGEDKDVVLIQLLLYGSSMSSPTQEEVTGWANHFHMDRDHNEVILRGDPSMLGMATYHMIPGFHLIDRDFVLRSDSVGHHPEDDLYRDLLPALGEMCR